jgi:hypothetical protein
VGFGESFLGAKDALAEGLLRNKEGPGNFGGCEAANQTQRKSDAPFYCEDRMAGGKDEAEDVIINDLVQSLIHCFTEPLLLKF